MSSKEPASETSEEFAARVGAILANGFASLGIALGHEVGLFNILSDMKEPKSSQEIADAGNFKERYVREWLGAMVTARIVELDSTGEKYFLPPNRSPALTHNGKLSDGVVMSSLIPTFGGNVFGQVKACFKKDGPRGVSFDAYCSSYEVIGRMTENYLENNPIASLLSKYPDLTKRLDDTELPADWTNKFEFAFMFETLHDQAYPDKAISEVYRILAPDGVCLVVEPTSFSKLKDNRDKLEGIHVFYMASLMFCMPTSLYSEGGMGLGAVWGWEKATELITAAGFKVCTVVQDLKTVFQHFYCMKK
ncbi:hypothetical protein BSL78_05930 [Apostichopus japonicus]|uniref:Uncharacterized protein n=1 Tax=Stichopus japonicus TaxID=307972 RepID=A0A2G8LA79_STIJA|nr:hypothetical protein BSL78_05930 [Apostichopus japonicus]